MKTKTKRLFRILDEEIKDLNLSFFSENSCKIMNISTVYDLLVARKMDRRKYNKIFGNKSRKEINSLIQKNNDLKIFDYCEN